MIIPSEHPSSNIALHQLFIESVPARRPELADERCNQDVLRRGDGAPLGRACWHVPVLPEQCVCERARRREEDCCCALAAGAWFRFLGIPCLIGNFYTIQWGQRARTHFIWSGRVDLLD